MDFYTHERTALFIDGVDTISACRALGFNIDFKKLLGLFIAKTRLLRATYYTLAGDEPDDTTTRSLIDWLAYNGYAVVSKPERAIGSGGIRRGTANSIAVDIAVDAIRLSADLDHAVLFSGQGDFRYLLASLQKGGCRVSVVSSRKAAECAVSDDLRRQADQFIELADLQNEISLETMNRGLVVESRRRREPKKIVREEPAGRG
jgi:uncharacterized LabA/DUF88 family protein